jgi:hypothetical protein
MTSLTASRKGKDTVMKAKRECRCAEEHPGHMCELESEQDWETIRCVTDRPTVQCENCGARANAARYVCMSEELQAGDAGVSRRTVS